MAPCERSDCITHPVVKTSYSAQSIASLIQSITVYKKACSLPLNKAITEILKRTRIIQSLVFKIASTLAIIHYLPNNAVSQGNRQVEHHRITVSSDHTEIFPSNEPSRLQILVKGDLFS